MGINSVIKMQFDIFSKQSREGHLSIQPVTIITWNTGWTSETKLPWRDIRFKIHSQGTFHVFASSK